MKKISLLFIILLGISNIAISQNSFSGTVFEENTNSAIPYSIVKVKDKNMIFLGIALQDTEKDSRAFLEEFKITYPNGRDESGKIAVDYGTWGIPESFFIDAQGRITYKHVGGIRAALVIAKLAEAAKGIVSAQEGKGDFIPVR